MTNQTILLVDDDDTLITQVGQFLQQSQYNIVLAFDGRAGLAAFEHHHPDLVLLDWMMPEINGIDLCREIRRQSEVPIIMLTAKGEETDKIIGLELGADDYMTKPYSLRELLARIRSNLRRTTSKSLPPQSRLSFPHFELNVSERKLIVDDHSVEITRTEFDMLQLFCSNPGLVYSRDVLLERISGKESEAFDRAVDMHISNLRKKIEPNPKKPIYLITVWGIGYRFENQS